MSHIQSAVGELKELQKELYAYRHAIEVLNIDAATAAPRDSWEGRSKSLETLSGMLYRLTTDPHNEELFDTIREEGGPEDPISRREIEELEKEYQHIRKIPEDEYVAYQVLLNDAFSVWTEAKARNDYALFQPLLEKIIAFNRKMAHYYDAAKDPYEVLLNLYEEGITVQALDSFFRRLREAIVPLLAQIRSKPQIDSSFLNQDYPVDAQKKLSAYIMELMQLPSGRCTLAESEHPFTSGMNNRDVRITTHYHSDFTSSMFSVIHEGGHALYEIGADDKYNYTPLSGGVSMGIHESQSRLYENLIGRSQAFLHAVYPKLLELFPQQLKDVSEDALWRAVNKAQPSLIRTEADELTYSLHVMVRYELEKELIAGTLSAADLPARWNALYQEYLGVEVPSDTEGCLQDSHWSGGSFGYFPSYALGSAYGVQFLNAMQGGLGDFYTDIANGDLSRVNAWLREHIHRHASFKKPAQLLNDVVGGFDPEPYIHYLTCKYAAIYCL